MTFGRNLIEIQCFEDKLGGEPKFRIRLPDVPRKGESITLPDHHYIVEKVYWQAHIPLTEAPQGFEYPPNTYYTIRMVVRNKFPKGEQKPPEEEHASWCITRKSCNCQPKEKV